MTLLLRCEYIHVHFCSFSSNFRLLLAVVPEVLFPKTLFDLVLPKRRLVMVELATEKKPSNTIRKPTNIKHIKRVCFFYSNNILKHFADFSIDGYLRLLAIKYNFDKLAQQSPEKAVNLIARDVCSDPDLAKKIFYNHNEQTFTNGVDIHLGEQSAVIIDAGETGGHDIS